MKHFFSYIRVNNDTRAVESSPKYQVLALNKLHPIDAIKVLTEQYLLIGYLDLTECNLTAMSLRSTINDLLNELPARLSGKFSVFDDLYQQGLKRCYALSGQQYGSIHPEEIISLFRYDTEAKYDSFIYHGSITEDFLYQLCNLLMNYQNTSIFPNNKLLGTNFYAPAICPVVVELPGISNTEDKYHCVIELWGIEVSSYDATGSNGSLLDIVERFSFPNTDINRMIGILSSFSIERYKYDMTNFGAKSKIALQDVCFDVVTMIAPTCAYGQCCIDVLDTVNLDKELKVFVRMVDAGKLRPLCGDKSACGFIGKLLRSCNADPQLVNYFSKPVEAITAAESYAYTHSKLAKLIKDQRLILATEADEPDLNSAGMDNTDNSSPQNDSQDNNGDNAPNDNPNDDAGNDDTDMDFTSGEDADDDNVDNNKDEDLPTKKANHRPEIDPKYMLLELGSPAESLSDYLYRDLVSRRISYILKNPPENARPDVLQLLKVWKNQWLFIVSIPTIRDFLSRIALRIS